MSIKYLKDHLLKAVRKQVTSMDENLIKWVLTIPAIWREEAKQFMREAAVQAGLIQFKDSKKLMICLEPEAASIICRNSDINHFTEKSDYKDASFKTGTKYILVDAGGGTVDITVHEVMVTGNVKELHSSSGGPWGGTTVDNNFVKLMEDVLGKNFITAFKIKYPQQWFRFMVQFERLKKAVTPDGKSKISIELPWSMRDFYQENNGKQIDKVIKEQTQLGVGFSNGVIIVKPVAVESFFESVTRDIVNHLQNLMKSPKVIDCQYLLLVGGFGESAYLQEEIMRVVGENLKVLVPSEAQMAIIKGAVLFGHKPTSIESRIARKTYGCEAGSKCEEGEHDEKYTYKDRDGVLRYKGFKLYVRKGDEIKIGDKLSFTHTPMYADQKDMLFNLKCSDKTSIAYAEEDGVSSVGSFSVKCPDITGGLDRKVQVELTFGGTEIEIHAKDPLSGNTAKTVIDFLSD